LHNGETGVAVAVYTMAMTFTSFVFARGHQCGCARTNQRRGLIEIIHDGYVQRATGVSSWSLFPRRRSTAELGARQPEAADTRPPN